ncbi:MAG: hypothetical protein Kow0031_38890 [Anaerolineae bacterium]
MTRLRRSLSGRGGKTIALALFFAAIALLYTLPIFRHPTWWGAQDWDQHMFYHDVPRQTLLEYGQIPLWNPYYMGGVPLLANPQSRLLSPSFGLVLLFGVEAGLKLDIWLHVVISLWGAFLLARHFGLKTPGALVTALAFALNSMTALHLTVGMTWFLAVAYLPWAFLCYLKTVDDLRYAPAAGLALALMLFNGGAYPLPITLLFLAIYSALLLLFRERRFWSLVKAMAATLGFMAGLGAIKLFPLLEFQLTHPRFYYDYSGFSLSSLAYSLLNRAQTKGDIINLAIEGRGFLTGVTGGMAENGMYLGWLILLLAVVGVGLHHKQRLMLLLSALIFLWISFGNRPRLEWWTLLHLLPGFNAMRIAQRFRIVLVLCVAVLAGFGFETVRNGIIRRVSPPRRPVAARLTWLIPAVILIDLLSVAQPIFREAFIIPPFRLPASPEFTQVWGYPSYNADGWVLDNPKDRIDWSQPLSPEQWVELYTDPLILHASQGAMLPAFRANTGTINGYESANVPRRAIAAGAQDYRGEVYLTHEAGEARLAAWSPNRLVVDVAARKAGYLVVNQNWYSGWRAGDGRVVGHYDGLIATRISPEDREIVLYYWPLSFVTGGLVSALALAAAGAWLWLLRKRD